MVGGKFCTFQVRGGWGGRQVLAGGPFRPGTLSHKGATGKKAKCRGNSRASEVEKGGKKECLGGKKKSKRAYLGGCKREN